MLVDDVAMTLAILADFLLLGDEVVAVEHQRCLHLGVDLFRILFVCATHGRDVARVLRLINKHLRTALARRFYALEFLLSDGAPNSLEVVDFAPEVQEGDVEDVFTAKIALDLLH